PVVEGEPAPDLLVARHDLRHEIMLLHPCLEFRVPPRRMLEELRRAEQDDGQLHRGKCHVVLLISRQRASARSARACPLRGAAGSKAGFCNNSVVIETGSTSGQFMAAALRQG